MTAPRSTQASRLPRTSPATSRWCNSSRWQQTFSQQRSATGFSITPQQSSIAREGPYADLYIVTLNAPATGAYRSRSFSATKTISEKLIADKRFSAQVRRIAYLEAVPEASGLTFHSRCAYGDRL